MSQTPADDFLGISIRDQMQIAASCLQINIGDVADPQLIRCCRRETLDEVFPFVEPVIGIGGGAGSAPFQHQLVSAQQF